MGIAKRGGDVERAIARAPVVSSVIRSVGYDPGLALLEIEFVTDRIYRFHLVPRRVWDELMRAPAKGHYFDRAIRGKFPTGRLR
jgi:hypothetical protein